ncbi:hypothetical protein KFE25_001756 [Diacronema lutheri]|uniref:Pseudouridine synthase RsuA/RluA-like domain-containing protein n=2 Tax=Diacronema lutheri TaxID=2081491 RepID=A0A8J6CCY6_DIALT|nr:hypothetical protein KFE25_001756 [Diacronema lutheri]
MLLLAAGLASLRAVGVPRHHVRASSVTASVRRAAALPDALGEDGAARGAQRAAVGAADVGALARLPEVLFEDDDALVVAKAAGRSFHASAGDPGVLGDLRRMQADGALAYRGELLSVHRLDSVTSGVLILAKSPASQAAICREFEERRVDKFYVGLSGRSPTKREGKVVGDMDKARRGCYKLLRTTANPAITHFATRGLPCATRRGIRVLLMKPETGKTHQLRVAMKSLGAPLLGDARYSRASDAAREDRCYLHAAAIRLHLPGRAAPIRAVRAPVEGAAWAMDSEFGQLWRALFPPELELAAAPCRAGARGAGAQGVAGDGADGAGAADDAWAWSAARRRMRGTASLFESVSAGRGMAVALASADSPAPRGAAVDAEPRAPTMASRA